MPDTRTVFEKLAEAIFISLFQILQDLQKGKVSQTSYHLTSPKGSRTPKCDVVLDEDRRTAKVTANSPMLVTELARLLRGALTVGRVDSSKTTITISLR